MLSLRNLCFLKVSSLKLPHDDIPVPLRAELEKMDIFNGNFSGVECQDYKKTVLTIQFMGEGTWAFQVRCIRFKCKFCDVDQGCDKKSSLNFFVVEEGKAFEADISVCKALINVGHIEVHFDPDRDRKRLSAVFNVDKSVPGKFGFRFSRPMVCEETGNWDLIYTVNFRILGPMEEVCLNSLHPDVTTVRSVDSRVLVHSMTMASATFKGLGEIPVGLTECEVSATDTIFESGACDFVGDVEAAVEDEGLVVNEMMNGGMIGYEEYPDFVVEEAEGDVDIAEAEEV